MSVKDSNSSQREDIIKQEDVNRFQYADDQKVGEFDDSNNNNAFPLPSYNQNSKRPKSNMAFGKGRKLRVDQLSAQDIQAILMENYSLRQEIEALSHQFAIEKLNLHRQLRNVTARNQYLEEEMRLMHKKRYRQKQDTMIIDETNKKGSLLERRKSLNDIEGPLYEDDRPVYPSYNSYYYDKYSFNNEEDLNQDLQYEDEDYPVEDDDRFFKPHPYPAMHPPPPPPHPNFGPMPPHMSYHIRHHQGPPPPPQPWLMSDMAYDPPRSLHRRRSRSSKGRYNDEDNPENEEAMLHLMQQMALDSFPLRPSMPMLSPQSQHPLNNSRRRKASFT